MEDKGVKLNINNAIIVLTIILTFISKSYRTVGFFWIAFIIIFGIVEIIRTGNKYGAAHYIAAYLAGAEVLFRMINISPLWETGKYSVILILSIGLIVQKGRSYTFTFLPILFFIVLIPSIFLLDLSNFNLARQAISFNLGGPFSLMVATAYFYKRNFKKEEFVRLIKYFIYPIISMLFVVIMTAPDLREAEFGIASSVITSGGYSGPNQVSTIYGAAVCILGLALILNIKIINRRNIDIVLIITFFISAVLTFSRGGVFAALLTMIFAMMTYLIYERKNVKIIKQILQFVLYTTIIFLLFEYLNIVTDDALIKRFKTKSYETEEVMKSETQDVYDKYSSGRLKIIKADLIIFSENFWLGLGPGMAGEQRKSLDAKPLAHTEQTRLLAEHGLLGLISLIVLVFMPVRAFYQNKDVNNKVILVTLVLYCFFTMGHAATRLVLPGFFYGLAFIHLVQSNPLIRTNNNSNRKEIN